MSREASGAPGILTKNACALALAWTAQRASTGKAHPYVDAAMEDLLLPVSDGTQTLLALMGANSDDAVGGFTEEAIRTKGAVAGLSARALLSVLNYWQERMAGGQYLPVTQPLIDVFADKCAQVDIGSTRESAVAKRDGFVFSVRTQTDALSQAYAAYGGICTGLDAAYVIGQAPASSTEVFLQRLVQVRPRMVDGMQKAIASAEIPVERHLYLTSTAAIPGLDPLPFALQKAGNAIYHPEIAGIPPAAAGLAPYVRKTGAAQADAAIEGDRAALIALREKVVAGDAPYVNAKFDTLRVSGREMTAAIGRIERPLLGVPPAELYVQPALRGLYYYVLSRSTLLKTRRTVLSVSLADYALTPTMQKQSALVTEIDSILGPLDGVLGALGDLKSGQTGSLITRPALALGDADVVRAAGPTACRLRFAVTNVGGASATAPQANLSILTSGVTVNGATSFTFSDLAVAASGRDSLELDIPANTVSVTLSATLRSGGQVFTDRRILMVPQVTTGVERSELLPVICVLHQNHPNPFGPITTISFTLSRETAVTLVVADMLGREVAHLCDRERQRAGMHSVMFDGRTLPPGVYIYRLEAANSVQIRKMVLMR
jgi:hypothetical protein